MMGKTTYILETKPTLLGRSGERIHKCTAHSLSEAINTFAIIKQLRPDQLLEIFKVYEQPTDGK
jgi:hypothetical protein